MSLSEDEAHRVLARAVELDEERSTEVPVARLRQVAREAGISVDAFELALRERRHPGRSPRGRVTSQFLAKYRRHAFVLIVALADVVTLSPRAAVAQSPLADPDFVRVPPGTFQMGSMTGNPEEQPVHTVSLTHGFWIQKTLVTQAQWLAVMGSNPSKHEDCSMCPIENVKYGDAQAFIVELNRRSPGKKYRLPTEAEWEYAARAGTTGDYGTPGVVTLAGWVADNGGGITFSAASVSRGPTSRSIHVSGGQQPTSG